MSKRDVSDVVKVNKTIEFILNPITIRFLATTYAWVISSEKELKDMTEEELQEIREYQRETDYVEMGVELVNRQFRDTLDALELSDFDIGDLKRSYAIQQREVPNDRLGIMYHWITSNVPLVLPDGDDHIHKPLEDYSSREVICDQLFDEFIKWADKTERMIKLTQGDVDVVNIQTLRTTFVETLAVIATYNPTMKTLFVES